MSFLLRVLAVMGLSFAGVGSASAAPITFTGSAVNMSALGDTIGTQFDHLNVHTFGPATFDLTHAVPTTVTLGTFDFIVGINALVPQAGYQYTLNVPMTVNGVAGTVSQPFVIDISYSDTLTLQTGQPTLFHLPSGGSVSVTLMGQPSVTVGPTSGTYTGQLTAVVVMMPEPATLVVFAGIAMAGAVGFRRRRAMANGERGS